MVLVPSGDALAQQLNHLADRLTLLVRRRYERGVERVRTQALALGRVMREGLVMARLRLERAAVRLARVRPERLVAHRLERLAVLRHRQSVEIEGRLAQHHQVDD